MVANLVDNAVRHNVPGGWIKVTTGCCDGAASVEVSNGGRRIPAELAPALFEPFQRLDGRTGSADGASLGLAIVRSVAAAHPGPDQRKEQARRRP